MIENGEIESMIIVSNSNVKATTKDGKVYTADIDLIAEGLLLDAAKNSPTPVRFSVQQEKTSIWITILGNWIPILAMIFFLMFMFRQSSAGSNQVFSFTRSKARLYMEDKPTVTFKDVAGSEDAKKDLWRLLIFSKIQRSISLSVPKFLRVYS